jgi:hypothetical protein
LSRLLNALTLPYENIHLLPSSELIMHRVSGLLSARLILNLREWSDRTRIMVSHRNDPSGNPQQHSSVILSFHAATVGRLTSSDEFGGDPLDNIHLDLNVHEEHHGSQQSDHLS